MSRDAKGLSREHMSPLFQLGSYSIAYHHEIKRKICLLWSERSKSVKHLLLSANFFRLHVFATIYKCALHVICRRGSARSGATIGYTSESAALRAAYINVAMF